ncbi:hypothetical protein PVAND_007508 [Polypedilum vanderplanki]|uniref:Metalloendopeptidase n=1 Tax=Polypedilum vanderplanki TaxID=319348 RepID=A0A9J6C6R1_POLVA|nr:hypothetical protein PVAND_007508 [Polypedilum vanderplanki]
MIKIICICTFAILALNSVRSLPMPDYVVPNTPENLERLKNLGPDDLAEELSGQFEGDMVMSPSEIAQLIGGNKNGKTGLIAERFRWPDNIIPYTINEEDFSSAQIHYIHLAAERLMEVTCLKFVPYREGVHTNYIWVTGENSGCWSYVGMRNGRQQLNLTPNNPEVGCFRLYTIVHEFMHALGFYHMQSATERDEYVRIVWENIQAGTQNNFNTYDAQTITQFGIEYDYGSVMHYSRTAFSINGSDTIVALKDLGDSIMGQRVRMSDKDIARINAMYCPLSPRPPPPQSLTEFFYRLNNGMNKLFYNIFSRF